MGLIHPSTIYNFIIHDITTKYIKGQVEGASLGGLSSLAEPIRNNPDICLLKTAGGLSEMLKHIICQNSKPFP